MLVALITTILVPINLLNIQNKQTQLIPLFLVAWLHRVSILRVRVSQTMFHEPLASLTL